MEFIGASSAGTMRIYVCIFLDKSGQYFCRYSLLYCHSFVSNDLFASVSWCLFLKYSVRAAKPRGDWSPLYKITNKNETELSKHVRTLINANRLFKIYSIILRNLKCQPYNDIDGKCNLCLHDSFVIFYVEVSLWSKVLLCDAGDVY